MERADLGASAWVRADIDWDAEGLKSKVEWEGQDTNRPHPGPLPFAKRTGEGDDAAGDDNGSPPGWGSFFSHRGSREKRIPGAAGQVVPPGPPKSGHAGTGLSQLI